MVDLFEEVEEELRSDRYRDLAKKAAPIVTGLLALTLLAYFGYWGFKAWQDRNQAAAAASYQKGLDALEASNSAGAQAAFADTVNAGAPGYKTLALMQEAGLQLGAGKAADAARLYDEAAEAAPNLALGDLSRLRAAQTLLATAPFGELQSRLAPLTGAKRPLALYAKETLAMAELVVGQAAQAKRDCTAIGLSLGVTDDIRQRCQLVTALVDAGEAKAAADAAKIAATLPPPAPASFSAPPPAPQGAAGATQPSTGAAQ